MRLRKIELIVIVLTFAFLCFMGGYFAGSRGSVNVVGVETQHGATLQIATGGTIGTGNETTPPSTAPETISPATLPDSNTPAPAEVSLVPPETPVPAPGSGDGKININLASRSELMDLPGIGTVLAGRIVDYRNQYGAFSRIEDIRKVSGIGEKRFEAIQEKITVS